MTVPAASVLLPIRDAAGTLRACLDSLSDQTRRDFEVVAVDDGSTDESPSILAEHARRDPRLRVIRQQPAGIVAALNRGLREASAPVLVRMDGDDLSHPERLAKTLDLLMARPELDAAGCLVEGFPPEELGPGMKRYLAWLNSLIDPAAIERDLLVECPVAHPSLAIRRRTLEELGGYRDGPFPEDYDLILRLAAAGGRLAKVPEVLLRWRQSPDRLHRRDPRYSAAAFLERKAAFLLAGPLAGGRPAAIAGAGPVGKSLGRELIRQGASITLWADLSPGRIGQRILGAPVRTPAELLPGLEEYILGAVGRIGGRDELRRELRGRGFVEIRDFRMVA